MFFLKLMRYSVLLIMSLVFLNVFAAEPVSPKFTQSQHEWKSNDANSPYHYVPSRDGGAQPVTISGEVSMDSAVSAHVDCMAENGVLIRFLVYRGGVFVCRNVKAISITSTGANDSAKGFFTVKKQEEIEN